MAAPADLDGAREGDTTVADAERRLAYRLPGEWFRNGALTRIPNWALRVAMASPDLHALATVEAVRRGLVSAYQAWENHFTDSGIPGEWLRWQEEQLRKAAPTLLDDILTRNVVYGIRAQYRYNSRLA